MATYITLFNFTDQGIRNVKDTTKRYTAFRELAAKSGVTIREVFWTLGSYDLVGIIEAPDDETATGMALALGAMGNVRTQTLRAFSAPEVDRILAKMPKT